MNILLPASLDDVTEADLVLLQTDIDIHLSNGVTLDMAQSIATKVQASVEEYGMSQELIAFIGSDYDDLVSGKAFASLSAEEASEGLLETLKKGAEAVIKWIKDLIGKILNWFKGLFKKEKKEKKVVAEAKEKVKVITKVIEATPEPTAEDKAATKNVKVEDPKAAAKAIQESEAARVKKVEALEKRRKEEEKKLKEEAAALAAREALEEIEREKERIAKEEIAKQKAIRAAAYRALVESLSSVHMTSYTFKQIHIWSDFVGTYANGHVHDPKVLKQLGIGFNDDTSKVILNTAIKVTRGTLKSLGFAELAGADVMWAVSDAYATTASTLHTIRGRVERDKDMLSQVEATVKSAKTPDEQKQASSNVEYFKAEVATSATLSAIVGQMYATLTELAADINVKATEVLKVEVIDKPYYDQYL